MKPKDNPYAVLVANDRIAAQMLFKSVYHKSIILKQKLNINQMVVSVLKNTRQCQNP